jgi:hypothetical protein
LRLHALFRLAFAAASGVTPLTLPQRLTRRLILQEARRQALCCAQAFTIAPTHHSPSTACKLTVSGSFHSPNRGTFHLSLTVLVHYRSSNVFSLGEWTPQIPTGLACPVVLRYPTRDSTFSCTGLSPSVVGFSTPILLTSRFVTLNRWTLQPRTSKLARFRLFPVRSPLLGEWSLFLAVLRCFSSHGSLRVHYVFMYGYWWFAPVSFLIRRSPDISLVHSFPRLIAVSHVLHRHLTPRHSP